MDAGDACQVPPVTAAFPSPASGNVIGLAVKCITVQPASRSMVSSGVPLTLPQPHHALRHGVPCRVTLRFRLLELLQWQHPVAQRTDTTTFSTWPVRGLHETVLFSVDNEKQNVPRELWFLDRMTLNYVKYLAISIVAITLEENIKEEKAG